MRTVIFQHQILQHASLVGKNDFDILCLDRQILRLSLGGSGKITVSGFDLGRVRGSGKGVGHGWGRGHLLHLLLSHGLGIFAGHQHLVPNEHEENQY